MTLQSNLSLPLLIQKLNTIFGTAPTAPIAIPAYANAAALPDPTVYMPSAVAVPASGAPSGVTGLVFVVSIARLAVSDGTHWLRTDTGAAL